MTTELFDKAMVGNGQQTVDFITHILQASTEYALIGQSLDGTILSWNEGARRLYGYEPEAVVGKASSTLLHASEDITFGKTREIMETAWRDGKWEGDLTQLHQNGQPFIARVAIASYQACCPKTYRLARHGRAAVRLDDPQPGDAVGNPTVPLGMSARQMIRQAEQNKVEALPNKRADPRSALLFGSFDSTRFDLSCECLSYQALCSLFLANDWQVISTTHGSRYTGGIISRVSLVGGTNCGSISY
jgi:PAS domain S-box-containing protein